MEILAVEHLSFTYPARAEKALDDVSFSVEKGEFFTVCGATGSGKSTLLRMLKRELTPRGERSGAVRFRGKPLESFGSRESAGGIGFVMQRPEQQLVTDKVWHELAFGLENLGTPTGAIRRRVAEMAGFFGIGDWFDRSVSELSGGQKQILNLAAVMVMQPEVLVLDEPTAQLDPIAASDFISTLARLNREFSLTIVIAEHRLEDVLPLADRMLALRGGRALAFGGARETAAALREDPALLEGMPSAVRLFSRLNGRGPCPLTVREGRRFVEETYENRVRSLPEEEYRHAEAPALSFSDVWFRYGRTSPDVLRGLGFTVYEGESFCILGGNGSGKSTALAAAAGLEKIYAGTIRVFGKKIGDYREQSLYRGCLALLPQDVQTVFLANTVRRSCRMRTPSAEELPFDLSGLMEQHPYDLSGGQQQMVALAKALAAKPRLLLLDEPTKGLDANAKKSVAGVIRKLKAAGVTVVTVTHDVEFAAACADRCAMFFRGEITSCGVPAVFCRKQLLHHGCEPHDARITMTASSRWRTRPVSALQTEEGGRMIVIRSAPLRKTLRFAVPFALIPAVIAAGVAVFRRSGATPFVSLAVTVLALLLFAAGFEKERTGSRRLILAAVMTALAVAGSVSSRCSSPWPRSPRFRACISAGRRASLWAP
jgi:energy-coupling factor transporter ATP-binding protein EcfA2